MTATETLKRLIQSQRSMSLENITITRSADGLYVINDYTGVHVCERRETMLDVLRVVLDVQDAYYEEREQ